MGGAGGEGGEADASADGRDPGALVITRVRDTRVRVMRVWRRFAQVSTWPGQE